MAIGGNTIPIGFNQLGKLPIRRQSLPFKAIFPAFEKGTRAAFASYVLCGWGSHQCRWPGAQVIPRGQPAFACRAYQDLSPCCGAGVPSRQRSCSAYPGTACPHAWQSLWYSAGSLPANQGVLHAHYRTSGNGHASVRTPDRFAIRQPRNHVFAGSFCRNAPGTGAHSANRGLSFPPLEQDDAGIPITKHAH